MARRRLEAAIRAGRAINEEQNRSSGVFDSAELVLSITQKDSDMGVYSLQFSPEGDLLAVGCGNGAVRVYNCSDGKVKSKLCEGSKSGLPITCLVFHPRMQKALVGAGADGRISVYNVATAHRTFTTVEPHNEINALDFSLEGDRYATAGKDFSIRLYDTETNEMVQVYEGSQQLLPDKEEALESGHGRRVFALKYHPDDNHVFITGGWDNCLKIWDYRTKRGVQRTIPGPHICGNGIDIKDGKILTASWQAEKSVQIWDCASGRLEQTIDLFKRSMMGEFPYCAQFCDNNVVLAGGSGTCSVQAIDKDKNKLVVDMSLEDKPVQALDSTNGGRLFALGGASTTIKMARLQ
ncbi:uncharacterized protein [Amphiura filiformis]|uniref:uncharacterized protein n=1 Tax=Amphiura filiformis TaxID=82378 RepID=UPI003B20F0B4